MGKSKKKSKKRSKVAVPLTAGDLVKAAKRRAVHAQTVLAKSLKKQAASVANEVAESVEDDSEAEQIVEVDIDDESDSEEAAAPPASDTHSDTDAPVAPMSIVDLLQQAQRMAAKALGRGADSTGERTSDAKKAKHHEDVAMQEVEATDLSAPIAPAMSLGSSLMQIRAQLQPRSSAAASVFVQGQRVASTTLPKKQTQSSDEPNDTRMDTSSVENNQEEAATADKEEDKNEEEQEDSTPARIEEAKVSKTLAEDAESWRLDERLVKALTSQGLKEFFPIQRIAVPAILATDQSLGGSGNDVCINAPTGSGKTLVYAVPVVQLLCTRIVPRLRALVIVPSRELATQVHTVFMKLCSLTSLRVEVLTGHEAPITTVVAGSAAGASRDILVATPGRLMDLLAEEGPVLFRDLRFLIVDEADRLMSQSYQDWLRKVLDAVRWSGGSGSIQRDPQTGAVSLYIPSEQDVPTSTSGGGGVLPPTLRRILCSATLTRNPQKLTALALRDPLLFSSSAGDLPLSENRVETDGPRYTLPDGLTENMVLCSTENKAQLLVHLLVNVAKGRTLVFTSSLKSTTRVALLLKQLPQLDGKVVEISSRQTQAQRTKYLARFREGSATVLIASDVMARGIDIANLENVMSYDVPSYIKTYVHRVGRTARAGATGSSFTLVRRDQARHFRLLFRKTGRAIKPMAVDKVQLRELRETFEKSVKDMKHKVNKDE